MHGVVYEYRSLPTRQFQELVCWVRDHEQHLQQKKEHNIDVRYSMTFGDCDLLLIRWFSDYFPFIDAPPTSTGFSRRMTGVYCPGKQELESWIKAAGKESVSQYCSHLTREHGKTFSQNPYAFLGVVYAQVSISTLLGLIGPESSCGPVQRLMGLVAAKGSPFTESLTNYIQRLKEQSAPDTKAPSPKSPRITPLLGLDRVPAMLMIEADSLDHIAAIAATIRTLTIADLNPDPTPAQLKKFLPSFPTSEPLPPLETWAEEALISDTATVVGPQLIAPGQSTGASIDRSSFKEVFPDQTFLRPAQEASPESWRLAGDPALPAIQSGGFRTEIRYPATESIHDLKSSMSAENKDNRIVCIGRFDDYLDLSIQELRAYPLDEVQDLTIRLRGQHLLKPAPESPPEPDNIAPDMASLQTMTVPMVAIPEGVPFQKSSRKWEEYLLNIFSQIRQYRLQRGQKIPDHSSPERWMECWMRNAGKHEFSYALTNTGIHLIADTLQLLNSDLQTFLDMLPSVNRLVSWSIHAGESDHSGSLLDDVSPHRISSFYQLIERLVDSRARRGAPIQRAPRPAQANDRLAAYDLSRLALSAIATAAARLLGLADVVLLDTSTGQMNIRTLPDGGSILEIPITQYQVPVFWLSIGHELAHSSLAQQTLPALQEHLQASEPPFSAEHSESLLLGGRRILSSWQAVRTLVPVMEPDKPRTIRQLRRDAAHFFNKTLKDHHAQRLIKSFLHIMEEILADVIAASLVTSELGDPIDQLRSRFFTSWGYSLVYAVSNTHGQRGPTANSLTSLILRVFFVTRILERSHSDSQPSEIDDVSWWLRELKALYPLKGRRDDQERPDTLFLRHLQSMRDDLVGEPGDRADHRDLMWQNAIKNIVHGVMFIKTSDKADHQQFSKLVSRWSLLAATLYRDWKDYRCHTCRLPDYLQKLSPGDDLAWSQETMALLLEYFDRVRDELSKLTDDAPGEDPSKKDRPWDPWLPDRFPYTYAPSTHFRYGNPYVPRFSRKGGPQAGPADVERGQDDIRTSFSWDYHQLSTRLMLQLVRKERYRQLQLLTAFLAQADHLKAPEEPAESH